MTDLLVVMAQFCFLILVMVIRIYTCDKMTELYKMERESQGFNDKECLFVREQGRF